MIKLPEISKKWGYTWTILKRVGDFAVMKQENENHTCYNVIKVMKNKSFSMGGNEIPSKESIPSDRLWGTYAWNYGKDLNMAEKKFKEITETSL